MRIFGLGLAALGLASAAAAAPPTGRLTVERVVLLMRHGVRPPTKSPPMPAGVAAQAWPSWPVPAGWLTPHGADAIRSVAASDGTRLIADRLLPRTGCPAAGSVRVLSDSDQRTIATGDAWLAGLAPGCGIASTHLAQDVPDPVFSPLDEGVVTIEPARADAAVAAAAGPGGIAAVETGARPILARLDQILCNRPAIACGIGPAPTGITPAAPAKRPKLTGALDRASTVAQILLLEYADDKPMPAVGWGRATAADISAASALHALEFRLLARPRPIASRLMAGIGPRILASLSATDPKAPRIDVIVGHDTNVAALAGLLDLHWQVPGLARDDPAPGGALGFELLRDAAGARFVRAVYRSQSLDQIRAVSRRAKTPVPYRAVLPIAGCRAGRDAGLCTLAEFERLMHAALAP